jgi:hypothetical protein
MCLKSNPEHDPSCEIWLEKPGAKTRVWLETCGCSYETYCKVKLHEMPHPEWYWFVEKTNFVKAE